MHPHARSRARSALSRVGLICLLALAGCGRTELPRPNILWIVWDTVRADHLSLYGHERETTPFLDRWAERARVFDDCLSPAGYTLPAHASMFTGLLPSEHGTHNRHRQLDEAYTTVAERLRDSGYRTFLYSANGFVSETSNLDQGFETAAHPWQEEYRARALALVESKIGDDVSARRPRPATKARGASRERSWRTKSAGELAEEATLSWLDRGPRESPFFVFLNYMEAHRPYIPARRFREQLMTEEDVEASYRVDRSWDKVWAYVFGLHEYDPRELELTRLTYDAALLELDSLLESLVASLDRGGWLENTIVVLTSDHGEHLGEQHLLDHQYSVYQPLLHVPLIVHYPPAFAAGHEQMPVMSFDLFPTLLELAGVEPPAEAPSRARSLRTPDPERVRYAEDPAPASLGVQVARRLQPGFDPRPWQRELCTLVAGAEKVIWGSDGRHELFDLAVDPLETDDRMAREGERGEELLERLDALRATLRPPLADDSSETPEERQRVERQRELFRGLGYVE